MKSMMPVVFIGHGSPMNAIDDNAYSRAWKNIAQRIPKPKAIVCFSAHWFTQGTKIMNERQPRTVYDMYGFPRELYEIVYSPPGSPGVAAVAKELISRETKYDNSWGIDHGTWSVLVHMFPQGDVPVFQISIDASAPPQSHHRIGNELKTLRKEGVLLLASGNIVHNLKLVNWSMGSEGFDWAYAFDGYIHENIISKNHRNILEFGELGNPAKLAVPTPDHFYPLLYALGAANDDDECSVFAQSCELGSVSMTSYLWESSK